VLRSRLPDLVPRHRRGRTDRGPRCADRSRRPLGRAGPRSAAPRTIDGLQIRGELPGRARTARIVLLQEQIERKPEAALGKTACAAMACRATIGKQPGGRFALIDILSLCPTADQHGDCAKGKQTAPQLLQRHDFRHHLHAPALACPRHPLPQQNLPCHAEQTPANHVLHRG
jgi:hypothetical protein